MSLTSIDTIVQCAEKVYDAIQTHQACKFILDAVAHMSHDMSLISLEMARISEEVSKLSQETIIISSKIKDLATKTKELKVIVVDILNTSTNHSVDVSKIERLEEELAEERKKRKALEMKMEIMYEWFKTQKQGTRSSGAS